MRSFLSLNREAWAKLYDFSPVKLSKIIVKELKKVNHYLTIKELVEIYLPLTHYLNLSIVTYKNRNFSSQNFFNKDSISSPFIIGITGSVASGKSTMARMLKVLLSSFLYKNKKLILLLLIVLFILIKY
ncbi:pantothenate kinase [Candidatus Photodesmus katoptron Akat1]|uniref:Pantothenate kinase n=1 Tax=Candidatus Photodesmus katoptron Akat1 TaxID=1236703 RepID=S3DIH2_9GAMM|nr:pantothenate kinase [Candidatus Photodesmus katoptron Akat1]